MVPPGTYLVSYSVTLIFTLVDKSGSKSGDMVFKLIFFHINWSTQYKLPSLNHSCMMTNEFITM